MLTLFFLICVNIWYFFLPLLVFIVGGDRYKCSPCVGEWVISCMFFARACCSNSDFGFQLTGGYEDLHYFALLNMFTAELKLFFVTGNGICVNKILKLNSVSCAGQWPTCNYGNNFPSPWDPRGLLCRSVSLVQWDLSVSGAVWLHHLAPLPVSKVSTLVLAHWKVQKTQYLKARYI